MLNAPYPAILNSNDHIPGRSARPMARLSTRSDGFIYFIGEQIFDIDLFKH